MATIFDIGLIGEFRIILPFLLIFCLVYAALSYTNIMGKDNVGLNAIIALVLSLMSLFSDIVVETINVAAPWFVILFIFIIFLLLGFMILGFKEIDIVGTLKDPEYTFINWWIFVLVLLIVVGSLGSVMSAKKGGYPPFTTDDNSTLESGDTQEDAFWQTIFHPKVLGFITVMLIAFITVSRLTANPR